MNIRFCRIITCISMIAYVLKTDYSYGQTNLIFFDDTVSQNKFMGRFENEMKQPYYNVPFYDLKEKLPDGTYVYIDLNKESAKKGDVNAHTLVKGQFVDSLRTGRFEYYTFCKVKNKRREQRVLTDVFNYKEGLLDGYYLSMNCQNKLREGNYKMGKRHGLFYAYDTNGNLVEVELYQDDTLLYRSKYANITIVK